MSITFHPSASRANIAGRIYWRPVVILRDNKGHTVGRQVVTPDTYVEQGAARNHARWTAHRIAERLPFARVA
jgi:hypothetical protein